MLTYKSGAGGIVEKVEFLDGVTWANKIFLYAEDRYYATRALYLLVDTVLTYRLPGIG